MEWISVEDRLPEDDSWILLVAAGHVAFGIYKRISRYDNTKVFKDPNWCEFRKGSVTHWMPLPEPPKDSE